MRRHPAFHILWDQIIISLLKDEAKYIKGATNYFEKRLCSTHVQHLYVEEWIYSRLGLAETYMYFQER
jgi:hypothetical protein